MIVKGYVRDKSTGLLINTNTEEYEKVLLARARRKREMNLESEIESVKGEVGELKTLVMRVLEALEKR